MVVIKLYSSRLSLPFPQKMHLCRVVAGSTSPDKFLVSLSLCRVSKKKREDPRRPISFQQWIGRLELGMSTKY